MEGDFPIVGVEHDAQALGLSLDRYTHNTKEYIKKSNSIPTDYITHILTNMKTPILYNKQLIIFKTNFNEPVTYKDKFYIREFTDVTEVPIQNYSSIVKKYYNK